MRSAQVLLREAGRIRTFTYLHVKTIIVMRSRLCSRLHFAAHLAIALLLLCSQSLSGETSNLSQAKQPQSFVKHTLSPGLIMAGYQGWFNTPDDGAGRGWYHYSKEGKFEPGYAKVDMWPEMDEYEKAYPTAFRFADGSPATTFSSFDESTVRLHFRWMQSYGIDGVYLQHGNRPVVAIWGVGFNDNRRYNLDDIEKLIRFFQSAEGGNCSVMLGVPTYWRQQGNDCIKDPVSRQQKQFRCPQPGKLLLEAVSGGGRGGCGNGLRGHVR